MSERASWLAQLWQKRRLNLGKEDAKRKGERFGRSSINRPRGQLVWFHAASIGEAVSILELVRHLGFQRTDLSFLLTTGTIAAEQVLKSQMPPRTIHQFVPYDVQNAVSAFLDHWRPDAGILVESELWPTLICESHQRGIHLFCINARMSGTSFRRWKWAPSIASSLLNRFEKVLVQDDQTASKLEQLGLDKTRMEIVGSLKRGAAKLPFKESDRLEFQRKLNGRPLWLAASTHEGEEEAVVKAHISLSQRRKNLLLVIVPRHAQRGIEIAKQLRSKGIQLSLRSKTRNPSPKDQVFIADTVSELGLWYRVSPVSFVGGSLVEAGGHNPFEPACLGSAIIHGPHVTNFSTIFKELADLNAALCVRNPDELATAVEYALLPENNSLLTNAAVPVSKGGDKVTKKVASVILAQISLNSE